MRLPRMTIRRWMIAVGLVALTVTSVRLWERSLAYRRQADHHAWLVASRDYVVIDMGGMYDSKVGRLSKRGIAYHAAMARKYRRAARYPWLPVEPDPPEPKWVPIGDQ